MPDIPVGDLRDVHQPILMHPDVDKYAEVDHVPHRSLKLHPLFEILHIQDIAAQHGRGKFIPQVTAGLEQFGGNIPQGRRADPAFRRNLFLPGSLDLCGQLRKAVAGCIFKGISEPVKQRFCACIGFGMHTGAVQQVVRVGNPEESRALFKRFRPQFGHLFELGAAGECAVFLPVGHDVFGNCARKPCHISQKRRRRSIQVNPNPVYAVLNHTGQRLIQPLLGHVMLVLSHTDRFRVDLDQFSERVLKPPRNRNRAAQRDIEVGELLCSQFGRRIDRCARLVDHHVGKPAVHLADQLCGEQLALLGGGAVPDREDVHMVFADERAELLFGFGNLVLGRGRVDDSGVEHLPGWVNHRNLAAGAVGRVDRQHRFPLDRRLHQQCFQVYPKIFNRLFVGGLGQIRAHLPFERGVDQTFIGIGNRLQHQRGGDAPLLHKESGKQAHGITAVHLDGSFEKTFLFTAVDSQYPVAGHPGDRLRIIGVHRIDARVLPDRDGFQHRVFLVVLTQQQASLRAVRKLLGEDVRRTCQRILRRRDALFRINKWLRQSLHAPGGPVLRKQKLGERLQPPFLRDRCAGAPLLLIRTVDVLKAGQCFGCRNIGFQFGGQLALLGDRSGNLLPAFLQAAQIVKPLGKLPQNLIVTGTGLLLPVARDKRDGIALIDQGDDIFHQFLCDVKFA